MSDPRNDAWLVRPASIKLLWRIFWAVLAVTVLLEFVVKVKGYFGIDELFGFGALFGFGSCVLMVVFAKGLGKLLKRDQDYYREGEADD